MDNETTENREKDFMLEAYIADMQLESAEETAETETEETTAETETEEAIEEVTVAESQGVNGFQETFTGVEAPKLVEPEFKSD